MSFNGYVEVSPSTAAALEYLGVGDGGRFIAPESAAWVACVLKQLPDSAQAFPHGKWATIQNIEQQVVDFAEARANEISKEHGSTP